MQHIGTGISYGEYKFLELISNPVSDKVLNDYFNYESQFSLSLDKLEELGFITYKEGLVEITDTGKNLVLPDNDIDRLAKQIQEIFPEGKKSGMYYFRSTVGDIKRKLISFYRMYKASDEDILDATRRYVSSFNITNRDNAMMLAKYFIEKNGSSTLYEFITNKEDKSSEIISKSRQL